MEYGTSLNLKLEPHTYMELKAKIEVSMAIPYSLPERKGIACI